MLPELGSEIVLLYRLTEYYYVDIICNKTSVIIGKDDLNPVGRYRMDSIFFIITWGGSQVMMVFVDRVAD